MNKKTIVFSSLLAISLILSTLALYEAWINQPAAQPEQKGFSITVNSGVSFYRVYVLRNDLGVTADENIGIKMYGLIAVSGDKIEIRAYSNRSFTLEFAQESPHQVIAGRTSEVLYTGINAEMMEQIEIEYTVP